MDRGRSSGASSRFIAFVARGAWIHGAGLHLLATRQRAVPRGRSWEKIRKESRPAPLPFANMHIRTGVIELNPKKAADLS
jgi:hypothetical protein